MEARGFLGRSPKVQVYQPVAEWIFARLLPMIGASFVLWGLCDDRLSYWNSLLIIWLGTWRLVNLRLVRALAIMRFHRLAGDQPGTARLAAGDNTTATGRPYRTSRQPPKSLGFGGCKDFIEGVGHQWQTLL